jgi:hypothetical protein
MYGPRPTTADSVQTSDVSGSVANTFRTGRNCKRFTGVTLGSAPVSGPSSGVADHPPATGEGR